MKFLAALPHPFAESERYLSGEGVQFGDVRQARVGKTEAAGTPTLLLVDHNGVVKRTWVGKLTSDKEREALDATAYPRVARSAGTSGALSGLGQSGGKIEMIPFRIGKARFTRPLLRFFAVALPGVVVVTAPAQLRPGEKLLRMMEADRVPDAVMTTNVSVAGKTIECGLWIKWPAVMQPLAPFPAGDDWLRQTTVTLFNRTNKTIVYGSLIMDFLDTGDCRTVPCAGAMIEFGKMPAIDAYNGRTGKPLKPNYPDMPPLDWKPLQPLVVRIGDHMDAIERSALTTLMPVTEVTQVNLSRSDFYFSDGMRWNGTFSVPDPEHPGKFKQLPYGYFPGARGRNLPPLYPRRRRGAAPA